MNRIFRLIYRFHKWLGIPLAFLFTMWYVSGIVMLYHPFPRLTPTGMPVGVDKVRQLSKLWVEMPDSFSNCRISFSGYHAMIKVDGEVIGKYTPTLTAIKDIMTTFETKIAKIDTLEDIDKWIPFNQLMSHLPIYRVIGEDKSYTYVSSKTGELLQRATLSERSWAWIGALPHYVYITPLRRNSNTWRTTLIWISGICTISVIMGLLISARFLLRRHKLHIFSNKLWQRHYFWGLFFGISMFAFIFSGMMSLAKIPDWIMKSKPLPDSKTFIAKNDVNISELPHRFGEITILSNPLPLVKVATGKDCKILPINSTTTLDFSPENIGKQIAKATGESIIRIKPIKSSIFYPSNGIPGYYAETENFTVYWNNEGFYRIMDLKAKAQAICYSFLHTMNIPIINKVKWIHDLFMLILLFGGLIIVGTGTLLSIKSVSYKNKN